jgi:hypothetical protein
MDEDERQNVPGPGGWRFDAGDGLYEFADPLDAVIDEAEGDVEAGLKALGYEPWTSIGDGDGPVPLALKVYARSRTPRFLVQVEGNAGSYVEGIYCDNVYAMMRLLRQWAPTAQAAALVHLVNALDLYREDEGSVHPAELLEKLGAAGSAKIAGKLDGLRTAIDQLGEGIERVVAPR